MKTEESTINLAVYQKEQNELNDKYKKNETEYYNSFKKVKTIEDFTEKEKLREKARNLAESNKKLEPRINKLKNIVKCLSNGGFIVNLKDKLDFKHTEICDFRNVSTDNFDFDEDEILNVDAPKYVPFLDEKRLAVKAFVVEAIKYDKNSYVVCTTSFNEDQLKENKLQFLIMNLDQLALTIDYYIIKAKAQKKATAKAQTKRNEDWFLKKPESEQLSYYNRRGFYESLSVKLKKKYNKEDWNNLSLELKQKEYIPVKSYKGGRVTTAKLSNTQMYVSYTSIYLRFVDKTKTADNYFKDNIERLNNGSNPALLERLKTEYKKYKSGRTRIAHPDIFQYYFEFRDAMKYKTVDIKIQRIALSETYQKGFETSYGKTKTDESLLDEFGILIKRQNGEIIKANDYDEIKEGWKDSVKVFGNLKPLSKKYKMVVSHASKKYQFANKRAIGIFIPSYPAIGVSSKYGSVQFKTTMAHEIAHFLDFSIGQIKGLRYSTDDYDSTSGKLVTVFRDNMNKPKSEQIDYINSSKECFARSFEQYFSYKKYGFDGKVEYSEGQVEENNYFENANFVNRTNWLKVKPLIEKFLKENADVLEYTVDLDKTDEKAKIGTVIKAEEIVKEIKKEELIKVNNAIDGLLKFAETFDEKDKELKKVESAIIGLKKFRTTLNK